MSDQPEALFLADVIENDPQSKAHHDVAAACLRRLHAENERRRAALREILSGHCPSKYSMTDRGLLDYHRDLARVALKEGNDE
jgi:hypothetical protein